MTQLPIPPIADQLQSALYRESLLIKEVEELTAKMVAMAEKKKVIELVNDYMNNEWSTFELMRKISAL